MPTVLIADDDPVSLGFLRTATERLGCAAIAAANSAVALDLAEVHVIDLLLLDLHMPDMGGRDLLHALRTRGLRAPAIATSAELDAGLVAGLRADGFTDTLAKPATLDAIEDLLRTHLALAAREGPPMSVDESPASLPILDDRSALAAIGGDHDAMRALRGLFAQELAALERDLQAAPATDSPALPDRLHRLRASSGFCGAAALASAALRLQGALGGDSARDAMAEFVRICHATRTALAGQR